MPASATSTEHGARQPLPAGGARRARRVEHQPSYSAIQEARATHEEPRHTAKTLLLHVRYGWRIAVLPANRRLDLEKARRLPGVACPTE